MSKIVALLKASHFGPTVLVTTIAFFFAQYYWWEGPAYLIAFGVFLGQLIVGWSNDLYDYQDDLSHQRIKKPLVAQAISYNELRKWTFWMIPSAFFANLFGPLGIKGGLVYMLGIACGVGYNFFFKFLLSFFLKKFLKICILNYFIFVFFNFVYFIIFFLL